MIYYKELSPKSIDGLLTRYKLHVKCVNIATEIPHSFWGTPEAGRIINLLFVRGDTPKYSVLHESCHYICMPKKYCSQQ